MTEPSHCVLVLDDDSDVRTSLARLLQANGYSARTFSTMAEMLAAGMPVSPACLLLDQRLGAAKGTEVHAQLQELGWTIPTIFLTADFDTHTVVQAMRAGANNYLTKPCDPDELLSVVRSSFENQVRVLQVNPELAELRQRAAMLTTRERVIVSMVMKGMLNKQIAHSLGLALVTVKLHRGRAMKKLGAQNAAELARIALRVGL